MAKQEKALKEVLDNVLEKIVPSKTEEIEKRKKIEEFLNRLSKCINGDIKPVLGGSAIKNTWLKDSYDADIFMKFDYQKYEDKSDKLSSFLGKYIKKGFKNASKVHGSRDYYQVVENGFLYEIIPILDIDKSSLAKNITDISPLHAEWVRKKLKNPDEVRLAKAFTKGQDIYGAESFIKGFSGYTLEILIVHYGGFIKLLKAASRWKESLTLDIERYHKNVMIEVNKSKLQSPLVLIDPVQKGRNVAAALSRENYDKFRNAAKLFLRNPNEEFFFKKIPALQDLKKDFNLVIKADPLKGKEDVVGAKLLKVFENIKMKTEDYGFGIEKEEWHWDRKKLCYLCINTKKKSLSKEKVWRGPPEDKKDHVKNFIKIYKNAYKKNKVYYAKVSRKFTKPEDFVDQLLSSKYIREKVKKAKLE